MKKRAMSSSKNTSKTFKFVPSNYNILIVEDSKSINNILYNKFTQLGYNCFCVETLNDSYNILEHNRIDYIMLDINLPDGNGYDLIKKYNNSNSKIFVLTSERDEEFRQISFQKGIIDYILKDREFFFRLDEISSIIEKIEKNKLCKILIIEDSTIIREKLKDILKNRNYNIETLAGTSKVIEIIENYEIDLIILDINLENENGIDFLKKYKALIIEKLQIPVLIISGQIEASTIRNSLKAGAVDVIRKPFIIEELILKVDSWIDYKRNQLENHSTRQILEQYKSTVDRSYIVSKTDSEGTITYVNDAFCKTSGYSRKELIGFSHNIIRHPDTNPEIFEDLWQTIKVLKEPWEGEIKNRKKMELHIGSKL